MASSSLSRWLHVLSLGCVALCPACGTAVYRPATDARLDLDPQAEINDEDVRKAFDARPQLGKPLRVAYYSFAPERVDDIDKMLRTQAGVADVYRIPPLLATGARRYDEPNPWEPNPPFSIKKLRLLAARAHCEMLVIFDHGHRVSTTANGWVASTVLVLPLLFAPFLDSEVDSYLETYLIDTRNGYLYAHVTSDQKGEADSLTIYSSEPDRMVQGQWTRVLADTQQQLAAVLTQEWSRTSSAGDRPGKSAAPGAQDPPAPALVQPAP